MDDSDDGFESVECMFGVLFVLHNKNTDILVWSVIGTGTKWNAAKQNNHVWNFQKQKHIYETL